MTSTKKNDSREVTAAMACMADGHPSALGKGRHHGSETSVGLPGDAAWQHYDKLPTFRGETEQRRLYKNGGASCAVAERRC